MHILALICIHNAYASVESDWGMVVFEHEPGTDRPDGYKSVYAALAHKLSHIIYHDHD